MILFLYQFSNTELTHWHLSTGNLLQILFYITVNSKILTYWVFHSTDVPCCCPNAPPMASGSHFKLGPTSFRCYPSNWMTFLSSHLKYLKITLNISKNLCFFCLLETDFRAKDTHRLKVRGWKRFVSFWEEIVFRKHNMSTRTEWWLLCLFRGLSRK